MNTQDLTSGQRPTSKGNVDQFNEDVRLLGSYGYTTGRLSSRLANARISESVVNAHDFAGRRVLDLGCGDGTYTLELAAQGPAEILGIDPAAAAVQSAQAKAHSLGLADRVQFEVGDIYALGAFLAGDRFDTIVMRGVLHHLPNPARAIAALVPFRGTLILLEPNGNNPVLKILESFSHYHIEHEERSFSPARIRRWLRLAGFNVRSSQVVNVVPMFCPDSMARVLNALGPTVERIPGLRNVACGQCLIVSHR